MFWFGLVVGLLLGAVATAAVLGGEDPLLHDDWRDEDE